MPTDPAYLSAETFYYLLPEALLLLAAVGIYVVGAFVRLGNLWSWVSAGALVVAAQALATTSTGALERGPVAADELGTFVRWLVLGLGLLFVMLSSRTCSSRKAPEYFGSLLMVIVGVMLVGTARDLVTMFVGLELISIPTYVMLYLARDGVAGQESAVKYFYLSLLASALLLYGFSFLYGVAGSLELGEIAAAFRATEGSSDGLVRLAPLGLVLVFAGLGFKIAAVPFHFYAPDVYQGTTHGMAGLLSVAPKLAGLIALVRIMVFSLPGQESLAWRVTVILAALTMTLGNVVALWQDHIRRLLAYSSIAHAGYLLVGLAVGLIGVGPAGSSSVEPEGVTSVLFYVAVYSIATVGAFAALTYLGRRGGDIETIDDLAGVGRSHPITAAAMAICMFSLAGIPPLAGFWGKFVVFAGALSVPGVVADSSLKMWFVGLAILGILNAAVAAAYYLRIVSVMYFRSSRAIPAAEGGLGACLASLLAAAVVLVVGARPATLLRSAQDASRAAFHSAAVERVLPTREVPAELPPSGAPQAALALDGAERAAAE